MATPQETVVRQCLALFHSTDMPDIAKISELFAEEATYQPLVPRAAAKRGRAAVVAELVRQFGRYKECHCEVLAMASSATHVFTERRDHVTMRDGRSLFSCVNAVFEMDAQNRIMSWREYWDSGDVAQLLGTTSEALHVRLSETHS